MSPNLLKWITETRQQKQKFRHKPKKQKSLKSQQRNALLDSAAARLVKSWLDQVQVSHSSLFLQSKHTSTKI